MNKNKDTKDAIIQFEAFLDKYKVQKGEPYNFTSMGIPLGCFNIPDDKLSKFYKLHRKANRYKQYSITEKHKDFGPILIDLDLKFDKNETSRLYTEEHIESVISKYHARITDYLNIPHEKLVAFVFEKDEPVLKKDKIADGIHVMYALICTKPDIQKLITEEVRDQVEEDGVFSDLPLINSIKEMFDMSIIDKTNWMVYGSAKPDGLPYKLTRIYSHDMTPLNVGDYKEDIEQFFSIRKFNAGDIAEYIDRKAIKHKLKKYKKEDKKKEKHDTDDAPRIKRVKPKNKNEEEEAERARKLVELLSDDRASDYNDWIRVGWTLHNISESLLDTWIDFSKRCPPKYQAGECEKLWIKFKDEGYGMGSLCAWAKTDSPGEYTEYKKKEINELLFDGVSGTHYDVAKVIWGLYRYQYVCASLKHKEWFEFKEHRWQRIDEGYTLDSKISVEMVEEFKKVASYYLSGGREEKAEKEEKKRGLDAEYENKKFESVMKLTMKLKTTSFKENVMTECRKLFYDSLFYDRLDENKDLIGFKNGVYDLRNMVFREGTPDDFISFSTGINYKAYDENDEDAQAVMEFMKQIQPKENMRLYVLDLLASYLQGHVPDEKFHIWTGTGANGD